MKVTFVHHSCFVVELKRHILVFDYIPGDALGDKIHFSGNLPELDDSKQIFFFVSHSHKDHYHPEIFSFLRKYKSVTYVLGEDVKIDRATKQKYELGSVEKKQIHKMRPKTQKTYLDVKVETLRSNEVDLGGVAFIIEVEGLRIFHAGDLNWWAWKDSGEFMGDLSGQKYRKELRHLKDRHIDLAFVPVDGRMEEGRFKGVKYYLRHVPTDLVFPMHLWREWSLIPELKQDPEIGDLRDKIIDIDRENIVFDIPEE